MTLDDLKAQLAEYDSEIDWEFEEGESHFTAAAQHEPDTGVIEWEIHAAKNHGSGAVKRSEGWYDQQGDFGGTGGVALVHLMRAMDAAAVELNRALEKT